SRLFSLPICHLKVRAEGALRRKASLVAQPPPNFVNNSQDGDPFVRLICAKLAVELSHIGFASMMKRDEAPLIVKHRAAGAAGLRWRSVVHSSLIPVQEQVVL